MEMVRMTAADDAFMHQQDQLAIAEGHPTIFPGRSESLETQGGHHRLAWYVDGVEVCSLIPDGTPIEPYDGPGFVDADDPLEIVWKPTTVMGFVPAWAGSRM